MVLGKRDDFGSERYVGVLFNAVDAGLPAERFVQDAQALGYDFVVLPTLTDATALARHRGQGEANDGDYHVDGSVQAPMMPSTHLHTMISGSVSNRIVAMITETSDEKQMLMELEWAAHLTCQACIVGMGLGRASVCGPGGSRRPTGIPEPSLAQTLSTFLHGNGSNTAVWLRIRACSRTTRECWGAWNDVRMYCEHHRNLGLVLDVDECCAVEDIAENLQDGFRGEPLKAVIVSSNHPRGDLVCEMALGRGLQVIVDGSGINSPEGLRAMHMRLSHMLYSRPMMSEEDILEMPYRDFLQAPLQPLQDNLESQTYETFERDSPKYMAYEEAVFHALRHLKETLSAENVNVCVVGAGRGPLVSAVLRASVRAAQSVRVVAVEKNRNAVVHVMARAQAEGWNMENVRIVHADMRRWTPGDSYQADILVSELLGSFGDNELSPECLDGAQRFLRAGGISIPESYTSYLSPITASKVWSEVAARDAAITVGSIKHLETPFVVRLHDYREIAPPQEIFSFNHPNEEVTTATMRTTATNPDHNDRARCNVQFINHKPYPVICHGFAGYFSAKLWGTTQLSIHPESHTSGMYSWFPIFFPVRTPFTVDAGEVIEMSMFRRSSSTKVWYEWIVQRPLGLPIANPGGRSYHVGL